MLFHRILVSVLCFTLICPTGRAEGTSDQKVTPYRERLREEIPGTVRPVEPGEEFYAGQGPGITLMPVQVIGGFRKPGLYHIPLNSDLLAAVTYAGGVIENAELENLTIKRRAKGKEQNLAVNLETILTSDASQAVVLQPNDTIYLPVEKELIGVNTSRTVALVASLISIVLSVTIIARK